MRRLVSLGCLALFGCSFDSMGTGGAVVLGQGGSTGSSDGTPADEPDAPADSADDGRPPGADDGGSDGPLGDGGDDAGDDAGEGTTTGPPPDDGGTTDGGSSHDPTTGGQPTCPADVMQILWAEDAAVSAPMELLVADVANDDPFVATSAIADEGTAVFELDIPCAGEYYVWALVWDFYPGAWGNPDPDSYFVGGAGPEFTWRYGCQTFGATHALTWQRVARLDAQPCQATHIEFVAPEPGIYPLSFRNREAGSGSEVAAIAALLLSTDPEAEPYALYDPY